ncbi:heat-inducible transcriptional repressor HrcA [Alishewanella sp. 16-MA]|uniref:Heat-inducible transcription repressor HrcA n=1 Tax=Alishewanella maricola TaxID=2795740 RepID=A0ABS8C470_9ALTE|nr:heat-inducible transcriptional repressor HrcA [Alishewanella maricola]MCB5227117.1 heat-inducible transcriptional repressor HrcA [Alishewanella maricola]
MDLTSLDKTALSSDYAKLLEFENKNPITSLIELQVLRMAVTLSRTELILKLIVEQYLLDGQPVASKLIAEHKQLDVSSATVRNTMVQLEQQGLIRSPHTSAGRIPTTLGIRLFIDKMLQLAPLSDKWQNEITSRLLPQLPVSLMCQQAGQLLANLTGCVAIVSAPKAAGREVRQVDLVRLASDRLLLVVVDEDGDILHRIINCEQSVDSATMSKVLCLLNAALAGGQWQDGMVRLNTILRNETGLGQILIEKVLGQLSLDEFVQHQPLIYGQHQLLLTPDYQQNPALQQVVQMLEQPSGLITLLQTVTRDAQPKLILGKESGFVELSQLSLIAQSYQTQPHRFVALLGPRRMDYAKLIPLLEGCAAQLNLNLNRQN